MMDSTQEFPPTVDELDDLPTLATGQTCDLKYDKDGVRLWVARTDVSDGEPFDRTVYIEHRYPDGSWVDHAYYNGDNPEEIHYTERGF